MLYMPTLGPLGCVCVLKKLVLLIGIGDAAGGARPGYGAPGGYGAPAAYGAGYGYSGFPAQAAPQAAYGGYGGYGYAQPYGAPQAAAYGGYGGYGADPYAAAGGAAAGGYGGYGGAAGGQAASGGGSGGSSTWQVCALNPSAFPALQYSAPSTLRDMTQCDVHAACHMSSRGKQGHYFLFAGAA